LIRRISGGSEEKRGALESSRWVRAGIAAAGTLATLMFASLVGAQVKAPLLFAADFENGVYDSTLLKVSGNAPTVTKEISRRGTYAVKSELNRLASSGSSYRTEFSLSEPATKPGGEYWYGFSVYLPDDYVADNIYEILAQWHSSPDSSAECCLNPPVALHSGNGQWTVSTIWDSRPITEAATYEGNRSYKLGAYKRGAWTDWVFHMKWSPKSDGLIQVWQNGKKVVDSAGPIAFNDARGPYFKFGLYKGWRNPTSPVGVVSTRKLYHDEIRVASGAGRYADVAPGGGKRPVAPLAVSAKQ